MYSDATNTISFSTNGNNRLTLASTGTAIFSGSVGIGNTTPSAWTSPFVVIQGGSYGQHIGFQTNGPDVKLGTNNYYNGSGYVYTVSSNGAAQLNVGGNSGFQFNIAPSGTAGNAVTFTTPLVITSAGLIGINNTSPQARLDLGSGYGASGEKFFIYNDDNSSALAGTKMGFYIDRFGESNSVTFVFPQSGGTTSRYHIAYKTTSSTTITDLAYLNYNSTAWVFPSDERMKNIEGIIPNALDKIKNLRAVYYSQKRDPEQKRKVGLLAQDLLKVLPEVVDIPDTELDSDGNQRYMSVALGDTIPLLVKAIQEQQTLITALQEKLERNNIN